MASPARSDETWSLVATTRELVVMAPLASGEVMTAPLRCGWVRDCGGEVRVLQRDGALAGGPAGVSRGGVGVDDPPNVTEPRTEIPEPCPWNVTPGARRVVSLLLRHPSLGDMPRTRRPVPAPAGQDAGLPQPVREPHGWAARLRREEIADVMPLEPVQHELGARGAERRKHVLRDLGVGQTLRQSERPETARRGPALAGELEKLRPCELVSVRDRRHVPECAPGPPLHPVRPGEGPAPVQELMDGRGNRAAPAVPGKASGAGPDGVGRQPKPVTR